MYLSFLHVFIASYLMSFYHWIICRCLDVPQFTHLPIFNFYLLIFIDREEWRKRGRERERNIDLLFYLFMHPLVDPCMGPDWGVEPVTLACMDNTRTN